MITASSTEYLHHASCFAHLRADSYNLPARLTVRMLITGANNRGSERLSNSWELPELESKSDSLVLKLKSCPRLPALVQGRCLGRKPRIRACWLWASPDLSTGSNPGI